MFGKQKGAKRFNFPLLSWSEVVLIRENTADKKQVIVKLNCAIAYTQMDQR